MIAVSESGSEAANAALVQGSEAWLKARWCTITGSSAQSVAGSGGAGAKVAKTVLQVMFGEQPVFENADTARGHRDENLIIQGLEKEWHLQVQRRGFVRHRQHPWIGFSPDGEMTVKVDENVEQVVIECKSIKASSRNPEPKGAWTEKELKEKKKAWYAQIQHGLFVTEKSLCLLCVMVHPKGGEPVLTLNRIPLDPDWWPSVKEKYEQFYQSWLAWAWAKDVQQGQNVIQAYQDLKESAASKRKSISDTGQHVSKRQRKAVARALGVEASKEPQSDAVVAMATG